MWQDGLSYRTTTEHPEKSMQVKGKHLILGTVAITILSTGAAIWYHVRLTDACLAFWGTENVRLIQYAPNVELIEWPSTDLPPDETSSKEQLDIKPLESRDISQARGLIHLRAAFLVDSNFDWQATADPPPTMEYALRFSDGPEESLMVFFSEDFQWVTKSGKQFVSTGEMASRFQTYFSDFLDEAGNLSKVDPAESAER